MNAREITKLLELRRIRLLRAEESLKRQHDKTLSLQAHLKALDEDISSSQRARRQRHIWWDNRLSSSVLSGREISRVQDAINNDAICERKLVHQRNKLRHKVTQEISRRDNLVKSLSAHQRRLLGMQKILERENNIEFRHIEEVEEDAFDCQQMSRHALGSHQ